MPFVRFTAQVTSHQRQFRLMCIARGHNRQVDWGIEPLTFRLVDDGPTSWATVSQLSRHFISGFRLTGFFFFHYNGHGMINKNNCLELSYKVFRNASLLHGGLSTFTLAVAWDLLDEMMWTGKEFPLRFKADVTLERKKINGGNWMN